VTASPPVSGTHLRLVPGHLPSRWHPSLARPAPRRVAGVRRRPVLYVGGDAGRRREFFAVARRWPMVRLLLAGSGRQALRDAAGRRLRLVVVDARVDDLDVGTLAAELRRVAASPTLPVVVLGDDPSPRTRARMRWAGVDAYLTTPLAGPETDVTVGMLLDSAALR